MITLNSYTETRQIHWRAALTDAAPVIDPSFSVTKVGLDRFTKFIPADVTVIYNSRNRGSWTVELDGPLVKKANGVTRGSRVWAWFAADWTPGSLPPEVREFVFSCRKEVGA